MGEEQMKRRNTDNVNGYRNKKRYRRKLRRMLGSVLFFVIVLLAVSGLSRQVRGEREAFAVADGGDFQTEITSILDVVRKEEEKTVHLVAVGDNTA